jgi:hypothetical protein
MYNFETATQEERASFIAKHRLYSLGMRTKRELARHTVFSAIGSVFWFIKNNDRYYIQRNLEDILTYSRDCKLKRSVREHLNIFGGLNRAEHLQYAHRHAEIFLNSIGA